MFFHSFFTSSSDSVVHSSMFFRFLDHLVLPSLFIHPFACLSSVLFYFPSSQTSSFSQHWNTGDSHPEELEWLGAHPRFQTRSQPPLLYSFTSSQPQFTDCVAVSEHSIPGGQITLQVKIEFKKKKKRKRKKKKKKKTKKPQKQKSAKCLNVYCHLVPAGQRNVS